MAQQLSQPTSTHHLAIRALTTPTKQLDATVNFKQQPTPSQKSDLHSKIILPIFNKDGLYFTPTFILSSDQNYYKQNETYQRYQFTNKVQDNLLYLRQIRLEQRRHKIMLKPPHSNFCQICQQEYANYFEHTAEQSHQNLAKNNLINNSIQQLCQRIKIDHKTSKLRSNKKIKKNRHHPPTRQSEERSKKRQRLQLGIKSVNLSTQMSRSQEICNIN